MSGGSNGTGNGPSETRVTLWRVEAPGPQTEPDRSRLHGWLTQHGIDPRLCRAVEIDCLDVPFVRAEMYVLDSHGNKAVAPFTNDFQVEFHERILLCNPPVMEGLPIWEPRM